MGLNTGFKKIVATLGVAGALTIVLSISPAAAGGGHGGGYGGRGHHGGWRGEGWGGRHHGGRHHGGWWGGGYYGRGWGHGIAYIEDDCDLVRTRRGWRKICY